jgi:hypothetical protein
MDTRENLITHSKTTLDHIFTDKFTHYSFEFTTDSMLRSDHKELLLKVIYPFIDNTKKSSKVISFFKIDHQKIITTKSI